MLRSNVTKSLAAAAVGLFAVHAGTAQEAKNLPQDATAHFIYFPTGGYALDSKDQAQIRDVAGMIQSHPTSSRQSSARPIQLALWDSTNAYHNGAPTLYSRLSCMTTKCQRTGYRCAGPASACHSHQLPMKRRRRRTGWLRLS